jgi:hypothetical protein
MTIYYIHWNSYLHIEFLILTPQWMGIFFQPSRQPSAYYDTVLTSL